MPESSMSKIPQSMIDSKFLCLDFLDFFRETKFKSFSVHSAMQCNNFLL